MHDARRTMVGIGICAAAALGVYGGVSATASSPPTAGTMAQGVYAGPADPAGVAAFAAATKTPITIAAEFLPDSSGWAGMDGANGGLDWLFAGGWKNSPYVLSLGVPMIPTDSSGAAVGSLATGATGAYNSYFVSLAQTLVDNGESTAYLRLGWEFDGGWFAWSATTPSAEASYAAYFTQIVTAMRSVPGAAFRFVWNPDVGAFNDGSYDVNLAYPGNAYVDVIGLDAYDQSWVSPQTPTNTWNETLLPSLNLAHSYVAGKGEPLAFPEWGLATRSDGHGLGDDPLYINNMLAFMQNPANDVTYESYFNFDVPGQVDAITDGTFPNALAAFESDLSGSTAPTTTTTSPTATTEPPTSTTTTPTDPTTTSTTTPTDPSSTTTTDPSSTTTTDPSSTTTTDPSSTTTTDPSTTTTDPSSTTTTDPSQSSTTTSSGFPSSTGPTTSTPSNSHSRHGRRSHHYGNRFICAQLDYHFLFSPAASGEGYQMSTGTANRIEMMLQHASGTVRTGNGDALLQMAIDSRDETTMVNVWSYLQHSVCSSGGAVAP
jgi:hypothetical protein